MIPTIDFKKFQKLMREDLAIKFGAENVAGFWGNQNAKIVSVSQAPSPRALKAQKPFFDLSGKKLRDSWYKISEEEFYNPDNFYFTAVGMYYPGKGKNGDLPPSFEMARKWLQKEIEFLNPNLYILVGRLSAEFFFPKQNFKELIFKDQVINGVKTIVLPHPSPLNRSWLKNNPEFEKSRVLEIRNLIHKALK